MFGQLLIKECRQTAKSLIYWLIVLVLIFVFTTQIGEMDILTEPQKGQADYGYKASSDEADIMKFTLGALVQEYIRGSYTTYPIGFYKSVTLNEKEERQIREIVRETTGISGQEEAEEIMESWYEAQRSAAGDGQETMMKNLEIAPASGLSYDRFTELMDQADAILGGGSSYGETYRSSNAQVPKTYEDAITEYRELTEKDRLTGGYARLFSDYMGIFLGLLPVFLIVHHIGGNTGIGADLLQKMLLPRDHCQSLCVHGGHADPSGAADLPAVLLPMYEICLRGRHFRRCICLCKIYLRVADADDHDRRGCGDVFYGADGYGAGRSCAGSVVVFRDIRRSKYPARRDVWLEPDPAAQYGAELERVSERLRAACGKPDPVCAAVTGAGCAYNPDL